MSIFISAIAFFCLLTVLVLIHEMGHFFAARKSKVTVEEFGFGLPPRLKTLFWQGGTRFSLNWIPFGGFVRLKGENAETEKERTAPGSFGSAPYLSRMIILVAGVTMNFLFAILIFIVGFSYGRWIPTYLSLDDMKQAATRGEINLEPGVMIAELLDDGTAIKAGVPAQSILLKVDGEDVYAPKEVSDLQVGKTEVAYTFLTSETDDTPETLTVPVVNGKTGVSLQSMARSLSAPSRPIGEAVRLSFRESFVMTQQSVIGLGTLVVQLFTRASVPEGITGIVGIAQMTHASVQEGFMMYLRLVALLSLSLAILNVLPLPALDGGRLVFVIIEMIRRKPANRKMELFTNAAGFIFLIFLIVVITFHDIARLF